MRIGVIRGDMPGPIALMDLETVSQHNPPTEPKGQERRLSRPSVTDVGAVVDTLPAGLLGTTDISGGLTIVLATNDVLRITTVDGDPFVDVTVAPAAYATGALLAAALQAALDAETVDATARLDDSGLYLVIQSNTLGEGSYIEIDTDGNGSTFNDDAGFNVLGDSFEMPSTAATILALSPVNGPLDVEAATILATVGGGVTAAQSLALADSIAPRFIETDVAIKSFQVGMISGYRSSSYNPDPNRIPALSDGAAISVVSDDGTAFTAPLTVISGAVHNVPNAGDITITGTNLGNSEVESTVLRVTSSTGATFNKLYQSTITSTLSGGTQGIVTPTSIVIPASLLSSLGVAGSTVRVQYTSLMSNTFTVT